jgi:hypothetical protein
VSKRLTPISAARTITLGSDVIMQPKPSALTFSPVLPKTRYLTWGEAAIDTLDPATGEADGRATGIAEAAAGKASPDAKKVRRDDSDFMAILSGNHSEPPPQEATPSRDSITRPLHPRFPFRTVDPVHFAPAYLAKWCVRPIPDFLPLSHLEREGIVREMVLRLASDEVQEVRRALSAAHLQMLRKLGQEDGYLNRKAGLELCRRKGKLEALIYQLDHPGDSPPLLEVAPAKSREALRSEAA